MEIITSISFLIALTIALTAVVRITKLIPTRFLPVVSLVIGIVVGQSAGFSVDSLLTGATIGTAASGIFDVAKLSVLGK